METKISDAEWEVMRVIWTQQRVSIQDIHNALSETMDWKAATIQTLVRRLLEKGAIQSEKDGKKFIYSAVIDEDQAVISVVENIFNKVCARKIGVTIASIISDATLSYDDIQKIQEELLKKTPVNEVICNCTPGQCNCNK